MKETNGLLTVFMAQENIHSYLSKASALEVRAFHPPRSRPGGFYLDLAKRRLLRTPHEQVTFGVASRKLRVESAPQQFAHDKIFATTVSF
jgi:phenylalanyl-tRNA synthetase alpha subunit